MALIVPIMPLKTIAGGSMNRTPTVIYVGAQFIAPEIRGSGSMNRTPTVIYVGAQFIAPIKG